ncbi:MAG TPA: HEAT repeat domain-containing protein [Acidobacteriaceae bacterium]|jgi:HEAT repeat protein|nr:HEAT repeat domain-containing protein [Acidobacteriaceae bacterium]
MATQAEIDELFRQTLEGDYDDEDDEGGPWEAVSKLQAIASDEVAGRPVFDKAVQWCRNNKPAKRRRGVDILAQLGKTEEHPDVVFAAESYDVIVSVLEDELDLQVIDSCLVALGHLGNPAAVPLILEHRANTDPDVRFAVAFALGSFADDPAAIRGLLQLMDDSDPDIRDWATFGLGVQGSADTPEIREALFERLDDGNPDTREEAVAGLGKRKDLRVLPDLIELLQQEEVSFGVVEAASNLLDLPGINEEWSADEYIEALTTRYAAELEKYS